MGLVIALASCVSGVGAYLQGHRLLVLLARYFEPPVTVADTALNASAFGLLALLAAEYIVYIFWVPDLKLHAMDIGQIKMLWERDCTYLMDEYFGISVNLGVFKS